MTTGASRSRGTGSRVAGTGRVRSGVVSSFQSWHTSSTTSGYRVRVPSAARCMRTKPLQSSTALPRHLPAERLAVPGEQHVQRERLAAEHPADGRREGRAEHDHPGRSQPGQVGDHQREQHPLRDQQLQEDGGDGAGRGARLASAALLVEERTKEPQRQGQQQHRGDDDRDADAQGERRADSGGPHRGDRRPVADQAEQAAQREEQDDVHAGGHAAEPGVAHGQPVPRPGLREPTRQSGRRVAVRITRVRPREMRRLLALLQHPRLLRRQRQHLGKVVGRGQVGPAEAARHHLPPLRVAGAAPVRRPPPAQRCPVASSSLDRRSANRA